MTNKKQKIQSQKDLQKIQKESLEQALPKQRQVLSASDKIRTKTSNLPDPTHPPMGWKDGKGYDHIYPWIRIPRMRPLNHGDTVIFNDQKSTPKATRKFEKAGKFTIACKAQDNLAGETILSKKISL